MMRSSQEDEARFFYDVSTRRGHVRQILFRWKWILVPFLLIFTGLILTLLSISAGPDASKDDLLLLQNSETFPQMRIIKTKLEIHGNSTKPTISTEKTTDFFQYFDHFPGIQTSLLTKFGSVDLNAIKSLEIKWYKIHGPNLTSELRLFPNLEVLHLDNVTIFEGLQPTPLPKLRELYINQAIEGMSQSKSEFAYYESGYSSYLSSCFFFLNDVNNSTDFNNKLAQTKVNISIWLDGSIVFSVDPLENEIRVTLSNCRPLLENSTTPYDIVTLGVCDDLLPTSISARTKILNLYLTSGITTDFLSDLFPNLPNLKQLFIEVTGSDLEINMDELPKSLKLFSASSIQLSGSQNLTLTALKEFYFGGENQYRWVQVRDTELPDEFLLTNFGQVFPNIDKVGIFELNHGRYTFLKNVLNSTASTIVVQSFSRSGNEASSPFQDENQVEIENLLNGLGIPSTEMFFVITQGQNGKRSGRSLSYDEQIAFRYTMLGWDRIDNWDKYVHVRKLIETGFVLG